MKQIEAFLKGHTVYLTPTIIEDVDNSNWYHWYNDYGVTQFNSHGVFPVNPEQEREIVQGILRNPRQILLTVRTVDGGKIIGNACLQHIDTINKSTEIALTIGHPEFLGRTAGIEVAALLVKHAFERLNMNRVTGSANDGLKNWLKMLMSLGFEVEGIQREVFYRNGKTQNNIFVGLLARDYFPLRDKRGGSILCDNLNGFLKCLAEAGKRQIPSRFV